MGSFEQRRDIQYDAKSVLEELCPSITPADSERSIATRAVCMLEKHGITETWYHDCPALVLSGSRSCLSISGKQYIPSDERVGEFNMITVDLSPAKAGACGDCAHSLFIEEGESRPDPQSTEFIRGKSIELALYEAMLDFSFPDTTFEGLHQFADQLIRAQGFENLDFMGNLGHSIGSNLANRVFIEAGNSSKLSDVEYFTFEPHVREVDGPWGFKHESIYYFDSDGHAKEL